MKVNWGRVLNAGLIAEILGILVYQVVAALYGHGNDGNAAIITGAVGVFVFMMLGALWVGRKIESRFILHGFLVGVVAIVYHDVTRSLPDILSGQYEWNYWLAALYGHTPKILGGMLGGYLAGRRRAKAG